MRPTVIGIGAQKCASSWVHAICGTHPEISTSEPKEVDFFSYYFDHGYLWYETHFEEQAGAKAYFESSPSYFYDPRSPERAYTYDSDLKILAMLRDPIKRAFSNHLHEIVWGHIPPCTFEEGMRVNPVYVDQGRYTTHLQRWFDVFPRDQIKVVIAEDVAKDPYKYAAEIFDFMGVDPDFTSPVFGERRNESDRPRIPILRSALRYGGDLMRRHGLEDGLSQLKSFKVVSGILRANKIEVRDEIPPMRPETVERLREILRPEVLGLTSLLGVRAPWTGWHAPEDPYEFASRALSSNER